MDVKNNVIQNIKDKYYQRQAKKNKGVLAGQTVASLASTPASLLGLASLAGMRKVSTISQADSVELSKAVQKGLKDSGLYEKGVRVFKMKEIPLPKKMESLVESFVSDSIYGKKDKKALDALAQEFANCGVMKKLKKVIPDLDVKDGIKSNPNAIQYKFGLNAGFLPKANKIITPSKHLQTSVFHEMGHALNANGGKLLKGLQKVRPVAMLAPAVILLVSLLNKRKTTDAPQQGDNAIQKGADFVKKNAAGLTALSMLPMLLEEGLASLRGQGIAKNLVKSGDLSKALLKKVRLTNLGGFASYALAVVGTALAAKAAIVVKDKIQAKHEAKVAEKLNNNK